MTATVESLGIDRLSVRERLDLIDQIWDTLPDTVSADEIPSWHVPILEQRLAAIQANPDKGRPWEEVLAEIENKP